MSTPFAWKFNKVKTSTNTLRRAAVRPLAADPTGLVGMSCGLAGPLTGLVGRSGKRGFNVVRREPALSRAVGSGQLRKADGVVDAELVVGRRLAEQNGRRYWYRQRQLHEGCAKAARHELHFAAPTLSPSGAAAAPASCSTWTTCSRIVLVASGIFVQSCCIVLHARRAASLMWDGAFSSVHRGCRWF